MDERLEIGDEFKDLDLAAATTGTWVSDLVIPKGIDDGASDGALHIDGDSSHDAKFTVDRTRYNLAVVKHDPRVLAPRPEPAPVILNALLSAPQFEISTRPGPVISTG